MKETPNTVHGRLLEAIHIAGYTFERASSELEWMLQDGRWRTCGDGYDHVDDFLDTLGFDEFRIAIEQRKKLARLLADAGAGQRATARLIGVSHTTVQNDLGKNLPKDETRSGEAGNNLPPEAWFQSDVDPSREAKREVKRAEKPKRREEKLAAAIWPSGKYGVILADPPWRPDPGLLDPTRQIENQYPTATLDELIEMRAQVEALAFDDCVLLLWTTTQKLSEAAALVDAWGFEIKSGAVWIKPSVGMGYWFRGRHELLILATRGNPMTPLEADRPDSVIEAPRAGHSEKPAELYALIERMFPSIPKVEIFARAQRGGWAYATNEKVMRSA